MHTPLPHSSWCRARAQLPIRQRYGGHIDRIATTRGEPPNMSYSTLHAHCPGVPVSGLCGGVGARKSFLSLIQFLYTLFQLTYISTVGYYEILCEMREIPHPPGSGSYGEFKAFKSRL